jgi:hypothetical protein
VRTSHRAGTEPPLPDTSLQRVLVDMGMCEAGRRFVGRRSYRSLLAGHDRIPEVFLRWFLFRLRLCHSRKAQSLSELKRAVAPRVPRTQTELEWLVAWLYPSPDDDRTQRRAWGIGQVLGEARVRDTYAPYQLRQCAAGVTGLVLSRPALRRRALHQNARMRLRLSDGTVATFRWTDERGAVAFDSWPR